METELSNAGYLHMQAKKVTVKDSDDEVDIASDEDDDKPVSISNNVQVRVQRSKFIYISATKLNWSIKIIMQTTPFFAKESILLIFYRHFRTYLTAWRLKIRLTMKAPRVMTTVELRGQLVLGSRPKRCGAAVRSLQCTS